MRELQTGLPPREVELIRANELKFDIPPIGKRVRILRRNWANQADGVDDTDILGELKEKMWHKVLGNALAQLQGEVK